VNPFLRPDSAAEADILTDGAMAVLAEAGPGGLSISAIARWIGVTPPALTLRWREEGCGARARILRLVILTFGKRWHLWSRSPLMRDEPSLSLPATAEEVAGVRAWLSLRELARAEAGAGNPDLAAAVARVGRWDRDEVCTMVVRRMAGLSRSKSLPRSARSPTACGRSSSLRNRRSTWQPRSGCCGSTSPLPVEQPPRLLTNRLVSRRKGPMLRPCAGGGLRRRSSG